MPLACPIMFYKRKHIRLREFDYSSANAYFITVCVRDKLPLLGAIRNGICGLSEIGCDIAHRLQNIPVLYPHVLLDEFIVMPNHFHALLFITQHQGEWMPNKFQRVTTGSISSIINSAKGATTKWCQRNNHFFDWQNKFHDHVIRNNHEYNSIKEYIITNPQRWRDDRFYV